MNARRLSAPILIVVGLLAAGSREAAGQGAAPLSIEPVELGRRDDLANKLVVVEDRVARIQFHPGRGFDQIFLRRAPAVVMELPEPLRFKKSPQAPAVRVTGIVRGEGARWWVDVTAVDLLPADLDRLNSALATTPRVDVEKRQAWVRWAETRADAFEDETLRARARQVEVEILRDEAERPGRDPAGHWLGLARRARSRKLPEPEPS
ncbi:MAG: hypothetical protein K2X91_07565, partial [Thermoleophilia bacterium]|nr:hypothetical protein [Thermoleophilia bacterium]